MGKWLAEDTTALYGAIIRLTYYKVLLPYIGTTAAALCYIFRIGWLLFFSLRRGREVPLA